MESIASRANMVVAFAMSWSMFIIAFANVEQYITDPTPTIYLDITKTAIRREYAHDRQRKTDMLDVTFDLDVDMNNVFDWNTWTVFMYLVAEWETPSRAVNQAVIWDHIMTSHDDDFTLNLRKKRWEYEVADYQNGLLGHSNVTVSFHYNRMPLGGLLADLVAGPTEVLKIPDEYRRR